MSNNAISISNYLIERSKSVTGRYLKLLGLIKRVYFVHGFSLAIYDRSAIDKRFDTVEAWKLGPVIPSVYHTFKHNKDADITELGEIILGYDIKDNLDYPELKVDTPILKDEDIIKVADMVLTRYKDYTDNDLINLTHLKGSPWQLSYRYGDNCPISDKLTKMYYSEVIKKSYEVYYQID